MAEEECRPVDTRKVSKVNVRRFLFRNKLAKKNKSNQRFVSLVNINSIRNFIIFVWICNSFSFEMEISIGRSLWSTHTGW